MIQHNLYGAGGQKVANVATFGLVGGKSQKKDGGKQAMQAPKVHTHLHVATQTLSTCKLRKVPVGLLTPQVRSRDRMRTLSGAVCLVVL